MRTNASTPETDCIQCGTRFKPKSGSVGKFCCMSCKYEHQKKEKIGGKSSLYRCAVCHATLGFGLHKSGQFLNKGKTLIAQRLKAGGVIRYQPEGGSWQVSAAILRRKEKAWQDAWMDEYDFKFPEWKKSDFAPLVSQYQMMSQSQRKEHNKRTQERIRLCPIKLADKLRQHKKWKLANADYVKSKQREYMQQYKHTCQYKSHIKKIRQYPINKIKSNLRKRMRDFLKKAASETMSFSGLIGCNSLEFKHHIEKQFKRGMTWSNYGKYWHVDHILPCAAFDHTDKKQVAQCWHYTNLRPLRALENMLKSDTITEPQMSLLL
jgi:hypothetical protein